MLICFPPPQAALYFVGPCQPQWARPGSSFPLEFPELAENSDNSYSRSLVSVEGLSKSEGSLTMSVEKCLAC